MEVVERQGQQLVTNSKGTGPQFSTIFTLIDVELLLTNGQGCVIVAVIGRHEYSIQIVPQR